MADDSNRIGTSRVSATLGQVRKIAGVGGIASSGAGSVSIDGGNGDPATASSTAANRFGPRGNRMLPADYPAEHLDRRAARGTYLDILV